MDQRGLTAGCRQQAAGSTDNNNMPGAPVRHSMRVKRDTDRQSAGLSRRIPASVQHHAGCCRCTCHLALRGSHHQRHPI